MWPLLNTEYISKTLEEHNFRRAEVMSLETVRGKPPHTLASGAPGTLVLGISNHSHWNPFGQNTLQVF